jgi:hypothetical protein
MPGWPLRAKIAVSPRATPRPKIDGPGTAANGVILEPGKDGATIKEIVRQAGYGRGLTRTVVQFPCA